MKLTNPYPDRSIMAAITPRPLGPNDRTVYDPKHYEIPAGETVEVDDYVVASTLVEYGAKADPSELQAARELWAERNRLENSRTASAAASEGQILGRQQATVDVSTGTVDGGGDLKGQALAAAVAAANAEGAAIKGSTVAEKRAQLTAWQLQRGSSSPLEQTRSSEFVTDDAGNIKLDGEGQPILAATAHDVDAANAPHVTNDPAEEVAAGVDQVDGLEIGETLIETPEPLSAQEQQEAQERHDAELLALAALDGDELSALMALTDDEREELRLDALTKPDDD